MVTVTAFLVTVTAYLTHSIRSSFDRPSLCRPTAPSTSWRLKLPKPKGCQGRASWRAASGGLRPLTAFRLRKEEASMRSTALPAELAPPGCRRARGARRGGSAVGALRGFDILAKPAANPPAPHPTSPRKRGEGRAAPCLPLSPLAGRGRVGWGSFRAIAKTRAL